MKKKQSDDASDRPERSVRGITVDEAQDVQISTAEAQSAHAMVETTASASLFFGPREAA